MAKAFARKKGRIVGRMDASEVDVVVQLLQQTRDFVAPTHAETGDPLMDLIAGMGASDAAPLEPEDPALLRLLPSAHRSDKDQAAEFRSLTEHSLRQRKTRNLDAAIAALGQGEGTRITLDNGQAQALAIALTDVRLVLGERLDLRTDEDSSALHDELRKAAQGGSTSDELDPVRVQQMAYYDFLSWLQEGITLALMDD